MAISAGVVAGAFVVAFDALFKVGGEAGIVLVRLGEALDVVDVVHGV